jgi:two-component system, NtrC family, response regulator GlrR
VTQTTELDHHLPLPLTRLRRSATLRWSDSKGDHAVPLEGAAVIGSAEGAKLSIADVKVSRLHAELELDDGGMWLRDLGSSNGTWVDSLRIERVRFEHNGQFRVGATVFSLSFSGQPSKVALWPEEHLGALVGRSEGMRELFMQLTRLAPGEASVLIRGETGTGKELVARELHLASKRSAGPFVVVDCASLPPNLLEAELFGHTRGAFTGAVTARQGSIEAADGGTVFLDEIGELPLEMQPKLLRVLESKTVRRVGETEQRRVDVRFVSATHRDLEKMVAVGQFREDLFFRLSVLPLDVPPLRTRLTDLPLLLRTFLPTDTVVDDVMLLALASHRWPGNVRELRSFTERLLALGPARALAMVKGNDVAPRSPVASDNPLAMDVSVPFKELRERWTDHLEREYLSALIAQHGRNAGVLADAAALDRSYINRLLRKHAL